MFSSHGYYNINIIVLCTVIITHNHRNAKEHLLMLFYLGPDHRIIFIPPPCLEYGDTTQFVLMVVIPLIIKQ